MSPIIDLEDYRTAKSKVFTGRDRGIEVRDASKIDTIYKTSTDKITVKVPTDIRSINPSFLEEFLFNVVTHKGVDEFYQRINFEVTGKYDIQSDLEEAVESILREEHALMK